MAQACLSCSGSALLEHPSEAGRRRGDRVSDRRIPFRISNTRPAGVHLCAS
eukprot:CAMPEP_0167829814 /NCGR_PEP_ID=MMETSP0112_2-20121227/12463_1 /TAXON_ID=91324 /ORGANISM="Lotharella globosa, Strain CCCM811" /LENGTH=50 /DNA_ID=CAMNT_0007733739 /DNA_START=636 /DNA_END=784 /DNA_ORIENTATION=-